MSDYTPERWAYLKALRPRGDRMYWHSGDQGTLNMGINKEKRVLRALKFKLSRRATKRLP